MAEEVKEEANEETGKAKGNGLKIGLIIIGVVAIVQVIAIGVIFQEEISNGLANLMPEPVVEIHTFPIVESLQVNLSGSGRNFLRTTIYLEYTDPDQSEFIENNTVPLQALILELLKSKTIDDINNVENVRELRETIQFKVNEFLDAEIITNVYFTEFLF